MRLLFFIVVFYQTTQSFKFADLKYERINTQLNGLRGDFAKVESANETLRIKNAKHGNFECSPKIVRISDYKSLQQDLSRPQVLISGEIHGDERVGVPSSIYVAKLLVLSAECIIQSSLISCEKLDSFTGLTKSQNYWLAFLATRRETIIIPTANCLGYIRMTRSDAGVDPNRDFPYMRNDNKCFRSTTAQIFKVLMRNNPVQLVITFHGGMVALGYEWGSLNHRVPIDQSPDHTANKVIAKRLSKFSGTFKGEKPYPVGTINSIVYPVSGGMEDWMYASAWDPSKLQKSCEGLNGNDLNSKDDKNRAIVYLVETSDLKKPPDSSLGGSHDVLSENSVDNGHIPRNIRLILQGIDLLQPYVCFNSLQESSFNTQDTSRLRKINNFNDKDKTISLEWYVGGSISVNRTFLSWHKMSSSIPYDSADSFKWINFSNSLLSAEVEKTFDDAFKEFSRKKGKWVHETNQFPFIATPFFSGPSRWNSSFENIKEIFGQSKTNRKFSNIQRPRKSKISRKLSEEKHFFRLNDPITPIYTYKSKVKPYFDYLRSKSFPSGKYFLVAWAMVDQNFGIDDQGFPSGPTQSHLANVRTNSGWRHEQGGRVVQGRRYWPSEAIEVKVSDDGEYFVESVSLHCAWWEKHHGESYNNKSFQVDSEERNENTQYHARQMKVDLKDSRKFTEYFAWVLLAVLGFFILIVFGMKLKNY